MDIKLISDYKKAFGETLLDNFMPFWLSHAVDKEYGGYLCGFDRKGELFYEDKFVWQQGRMLWMFSKLYNEVEQKPEWLEAAKIGYDFINKYCFDENKHMYFRVTRDGRPLVLRRYYDSESFAIMGYAEYYKATKNVESLERAKEVYDLVMKYYTTPNYFPPKVNPQTRSYKSHSGYMDMIVLAQAMREVDDNPRYNELIDSCLDAILNQCVKRDEKALFEVIDSDGSRIDSPEGRLINPGHSFESAWFIMHEAIYRKDKKLMDSAIEIIEWTYEKGADREMGGIYYFIDVEKKPVMKLEWDLKLLWVHCEAMYSFLLAYRHTGDEKYMKPFGEIFDYTFKHFADPEYPEWYGHLHRDGTPITAVKGSDWKGPFHNVRAFLFIWQSLQALEEGKKLF